MGAPVRVLHKDNPVEEIWRDLGWLIDGLNPLGAEVMLVMYERVGQGESKTAGGIILPDVKGGSATEDKYQGKAGLIVKMGPIAFEDDASHKFGDKKPKVGDWVIININETLSFDVPVYHQNKSRFGSADGQRRMRLVQDVYVRVIASPEVFDAIW